MGGTPSTLIAVGTELQSVRLADPDAVLSHAECRAAPPLTQSMFVLWLERYSRSRCWSAEPGTAPAHSDSSFAQIRCSASLSRFPT